MRIFLCFLRFPDFAPETLVFGEYQYVDLLFVESGRIAQYSTRPTQIYGCIVLTKETMEKSVYWSEKRDFLELINVSQEDGRKLLRTCDTFSSTLISVPYNLLDSLLYMIPTRVAEERGLFDAKKLSDSQAVILMLRECLTKPNAILDALQTLNSRQTMPQTLYETLLPVSKKLDWRQLCQALPGNAA